LEEVQGLEMMRFTIPGLEARGIGVEGQALSPGSHQQGLGSNS
jgi:hypothetical protein